MTIENRTNASADAGDGDAQGKLMLVALCLLWGVTWPLMKIALTDIPPLSMRTLTAGLTPERLETAVRIAAIPQKIRGYGHIKDASVGPAKAEEKALWGRWEKVGEKQLANA